MSIGTDKLQHIVVLMMENRSFDHMLGFAQSDSWPIDGLGEKQTNVDSAGGVAEVSNDAGYAGDLTPDPGHSTFETLTQLYGDPGTSVTQNLAMSGFVRSYEGKTGNPQAAHRIMKCFSAEKLPVLTKLAQQFCVCDHWFSSLPGPTFPNRAFMHAATSLGRVDMGIDWRKLSPTIYERLAEHHLDSVIYYHDSTMASTFDGLAGILVFSARSSMTFFRRVRTMIYLPTVFSSRVLPTLPAATASLPFRQATSIRITT